MSSLPPSNGSAAASVTTAALVVPSSLVVSPGGSAVGASAQIRDVKSEAEPAAAAAASASSVANLAVSANPSISGLQAIFVTLLKADPANPGFMVESSHDGKRIVIRSTSANTDVAALAKKLNETFKSHGHTISAIPFRMNPVQQKPVAFATTAAAFAASAGANASAVVISASQDEYPKAEFPLLDINQAKGNDIFTRLFTEEILASTGTIIEWQEDRNNDGQVVHYYICQSPEDGDLRAGQIAVFKKILSLATWADLYKAFAKDNAQPLPVPMDYLKRPKGHGPLTPHLDNLISIREEGGFKVVRFDCLGLLKCVIAPQFVVHKPAASASAVAEPAAEIHLDHEHFMAYMNTLLNHDNGVMFHENASRLYPIAIDPKHAIQAKTLIRFGIDCSSSMHKDFPTLKDLLKQVFLRIPTKLDPHATIIQISRFGSRHIPDPVNPDGQGTDQRIQYDTITIKASDCTDANLDSILARIARPAPPDSDNPSGTPLFEFLVEDYQNLDSKEWEEYNKVSVLISDGEDNTSSEDCKPDKKLAAEKREDRLSITLRKMNAAVAPPNFFSIEIGTLCDDILQVISEITQGKRIKVGRGLENFDVFFDHLGQLNISRQFMHFVQEARKFRLPVIKGQITPILDPKSYIEADTVFRMNGQAYMAQKAGAYSQPSLALSAGSAAAGLDNKGNDEGFRILQLQRQHEAAMEALREQLKAAQDALRSQAAAGSNAAAAAAPAAADQSALMSPLILSNPAVIATVTAGSMYPSAPTTQVASSAANANSNLSASAQASTSGAAPASSVDSDSAAAQSAEQSAAAAATDESAPLGRRRIKCGNFKAPDCAVM